jgi:molecular chaperone DnaK (HSP70)
MLSLLSLLFTLLLPTACTARAILGVDLGSLYMKVALVQSGSPLEIVTNLHSKRKTEQMVLFDRQQRFYGADASALLARKSHQTPQAMTVLLGRDDQHPVVQVRIFYESCNKVLCNPVFQPSLNLATALHHLYITCSSLSQKLNCNV